METASTLSDVDRTASPSLRELWAGTERLWRAQLLLVCGFGAVLPLVYWGTTDSYRARAIMISLPILWLDSLLSRSARVGLQWSSLMRWGVGLLLFGYFVSFLLAEHQTMAFLRVVEVGWAVMLAKAVARVVAMHRFALLGILASLVLAYTLSNFRLIAQWWALESPRDFQWLFATPGYFHVRNLGFAAAPAVVVLAFLPFCDPVRNLPSDQRRRAQWALLLLGCLSWGVVAWSGSRAGILSGAFGIAVLAWSGRNVVPPWRVLGVGVGTAVLGALASTPFVPHDSSFGVLRLFERAATLTESVDQYSSGRISLWIDAIERYAPNWLFGIGPDQFQFQEALKSRLLEPHNAPIHIALESGLFGLVGCCLLLFGVARLWTSVTRDGYAALTLGVLASLFLMSMVDGTVYWTLPVCYLALSIGCAWGMLRSGMDQPINTRLTTCWCNLARAGIAVAALSFGLVLFQVRALGNPAPEHNGWIVRSVYVFPGSTWGTATWIRSWEQKGEPAVEKWYERMIEASPASYFYRVELAYFLIRNGRLEEAFQQFAQAQAEAPLDFANNLRERHAQTLEYLDANRGKAAIKGPR